MVSVEEIGDFEQPGEAHPGAEKMAEGVEDLEGEHVVRGESGEVEIVDCFAARAGELVGGGGDGDAVKIQMKRWEQIDFAMSRRRVDVVVCGGNVGLRRGESDLAAGFYFFLDVTVRFEGARCLGD